MPFCDLYHKFAGRGWGLTTAENSVEHVGAGEPEKRWKWEVGSAYDIGQTRARPSQG